MNTSQMGFVPWGRVWAAAFLLGVAGCASVPGETAAPASVRRDVSARVLARAAEGRPDCKRVKVVDTQIVDVYGDGRPSEERWVVERCDERINFLVSYPAKSNPAAIQVRRE